MNRSALQLTFNRNGGQCRIERSLEHVVDAGYSSPLADFLALQSNWVARQRSFHDGC